MPAEFQHLTSSSLRALAAALRSGRLSPPYTAAALHVYCPCDDRAAIAGRMQQLDDEGLRPTHLALLLDTIDQTRAREAPEGKSVDLVWSGPAAKGLANRDTGSVVRELFNSANEEVLLVGFAVHQGREVFRALAERMDGQPTLRVRMFLDIQRQLGDTSPPPVLLSEFAHRFRTREWPGGRPPEVFHDPRSLALDMVKRSSLHAKCVVVDRQVAFVTSANFTEAAQERNIEVGVLIRSCTLAEQLAEHFEVLAVQGVLLHLSLEIKDCG
jgi:phosphatidylserine/phosphatidylglycerophosphate/cardiolipin synthase-like enzyme